MLEFCSILSSSCFWWQRVLTDTARKSRSIGKTTCNLIAKQEKLQLSNKSNTSGSTFQAELSGGHNGMTRTVNLIFE